MTEEEIYYLCDLSICNDWIIIYSNIYGKNYTFEKGKYSESFLIKDKKVSSFYISTRTHYISDNILIKEISRLNFKIDLLILDLQDNDQIKFDLSSLKVNFLSISIPGDFVPNVKGFSYINTLFGSKNIYRFKNEKKMFKVS